jgi:hypothetical protein
MDSEGPVETHAGLVYLILGRGEICNAITATPGADRLYRTS